MSKLITEIVFFFLLEQLPVQIMLPKVPSSWQAIGNVYIGIHTKLSVIIRVFSPLKLVVRPVD